MKITGNGYEITRYISEKIVSPANETSVKTSTQNNIAPESREDAIVNLSEASKEVQKAIEVIDSQPDVRLDMVNAIQEEIEKGAYEVNTEKTAEKILGYYIDEKV